MPSVPASTPAVASDPRPVLHIPPQQHINGVVEWLDVLCRHFIDTNNPLGLFTALYRVVTHRVAIALTEGTFDHPADLERLDIGFANRYFDALNQYFAGQPATGPWQVTFDAADAAILTNQHLLAACNAHIGFDLPLVLAEVFRGRDLTLIAADFDRMNSLFDTMNRQVNHNISHIFPPLGWFLPLIARLLNQLENLIMRQKRRVAWRTCQRLHRLTDPVKRQQFVAHLEQTVTPKGQHIVRPFFLIRWLLQPIVRAEVGTPAQKIRCMLDTCQLPGGDNAACV